MAARDSYTEMAPIYDLVYSFKDYRKEAREIAAVVRKHSARPPRTLLDVACGTGAHLEHLRKWFTVEGLDIDRAMLRVARRRLPGVRLHRADFTQFDLGKQYDAVTCLFSAVGHATTVAQLDRAVAAMARHVRPGGVLVVEPWITPQRYRPGHAQVASADGAGLTVLRMSYSVRRGRRRLHLEFHYLIRDRRGVRYLKESFEMGLFTDEEYRAAIRRAGLLLRARGKGPMGRGLYVAVRPDD
jgi:ubiquinone/menaquinone biosynthesis C-methylase UbiE